MAIQSPPCLKLLRYQNRADNRESCDCAFLTYERLQSLQFDLGTPTGKAVRMISKRLKGPRGKHLPTASELRLLQILWDNGEATVEDVVNAHPLRSRPNYKTTQTLLRIMEEKGFIAHQIRGRVFVFTALISRKTIDRMSIQSLLSQNFGGSPTGLFLNLLESAKFKEKDLEELETQIREYRKRSESSGRGRT
ncbi:MAG: BlaI/MecI/CopY family transcriptional regulator [Acidobacteriaceae bacterium]